MEKGKKNVAGFIQEFLLGGEIRFLNMYSVLCFPLVLLLSLFGSGSLNVKSETVFIYIYI